MQDGARLVEEVWAAFNRQIDATAHVTAAFATPVYTQHILTAQAFHALREGQDGAWATSGSSIPSRPSATADYSSDETHNVALPQNDLQSVFVLRFFGHLDTFSC